MGCKHKETIRVVNNKQEFYCKAFDKEISEYDCRNCLMKVEDNNLNDLFNQIFGKGFGK